MLKHAKARYCERDVDLGHVAVHLIQLLHWKAGLQHEALGDFDPLVGILRQESGALSPFVDLLQGRAGLELPVQALSSRLFATRSSAPEGRRSASLAVALGDTVANFMASSRRLLSSSWRSFCSRSISSWAFRCSSSAAARSSSSFLRVASRSSARLPGRFKIEAFSQSGGPSPEPLGIHLAV